MKQFMDKDFLLSTDMAKTLYHDFAENMPILDYHCHINPQEIYEDRKFDTITQVWLGGDHYKWRQMRSNGIDEVCNRRQHGQGEVPGLGRDHAKAHRQPAVPLEPPGA